MFLIDLSLSLTQIFYFHCILLPISRPPEWDTDDIERQRKDFGDKISTLGRTRIERLWEAGACMLRSIRNSVIRVGHLAD